MIREDLGLNEPLQVQYARWLARALRGDLGRSIELRAPVTTMVIERFKNTAILATASMLLSIVLGVSAGVISATRPLSVFDADVDRLVSTVRDERRRNPARVRAPDL